MNKKMYVEKDARKWNCEDNNTRLLENHDEEKLLKVDYGCEDVWMSMYIRESLYQKLISNEYHVDTNSLTTLVILDSIGNRIAPISPDIIY